MGSIGDVGVYSLTESKSITCGEGGVVVTDNADVARRARLIRNHGEGVTDEGIVGMNFRLTDLQAALAIAQLEQLDARNRARAENVRRLADGLGQWPSFVRQAVERDAVPAWFVFMTR